MSGRDRSQSQAVRQQANKIRELRQQRKWTQWQLAQISHLSERTVQRIESGRPMGKTAQMALANAFELDIDDLQRAGPGALVDFVFLRRVASGSVLLDLVEGAEEAPDCPLFSVAGIEPGLAAIAEDFMRGVGVWGMVWNEIDSRERAEARQIFSAKIAELAEHGVWLFGRSLQVKLRDGTAKRAVHLAAFRADDPRIIRPNVLRQFGESMCVVPVIVGSTGLPIESGLQE